MEKLNRAQKCSILGPQNLGSGGPGPPGPPLDPHLLQILCRVLEGDSSIFKYFVNIIKGRLFVFLISIRSFQTDWSG